MILDPIQRRFGYGAARLRIVRPDGVPALSVAARKPRSFENAFAALPSLFCVGIAFLLFISIRLDAAAPLQTPLEIRLWNEPARPTQTLTAQAEVVQAQLAQAPSPTTKVEPTAPVEQSRPDFNLASLTMRAPRRLTPNIEKASPIVRISRPDAQASGRRPTKTDLAIVASAPALGVKTNRSGLPSLGTSSQPTRQRPHGRSGTRSAEALEIGSGSGARRQFLVAHAQMQVAGPLTAPATRPPAVSAAGMASARASSRVVRENLEHSIYGTGWQEVPLEELPDCSPAGRQDLLKKRILLAAPFERECSHQDGSYRFVETRNLGAFLMWSRTNPDRPARQPRARNVCDVLERALRCLDASSIEESSAR